MNLYYNASNGSLVLYDNKSNDMQDVAFVNHFKLDMPEGEEILVTLEEEDEDGDMVEMDYLLQPILLNALHLLKWKRKIPLRDFENKEQRESYYEVKIKITVERIMDMLLKAKFLTAKQREMICQSFYTDQIQEQ